MPPLSSHPLSCRVAGDLLDHYISGDLNRETARALLAHIESCSDCRRELSARSLFRQGIRRVVARLQVRSVLKQRVQRLIREASGFSE